MTKRPLPLRYPLALVLVAAVSAFSACRKPPAPASAVPPQTQADASATKSVRPIMILRAGARPLWFELRPEGPAQVQSPGKSSLEPFAPWPLARRVCGFASQEGVLGLGVNRDGFLVFAPVQDGSAALYRVSDPAVFGKYSIASVFLYRDAPTAILYRDHFFTDPVEPAPVPRAYSATSRAAAPAAVDLPALSGFPESAGWDLESAERSGQGKWFFRAVKRAGKAAADGEPAYASAPSLDEAAVPASAGAFRTALLPRKAADAEVLLRRVLDASASVLKGKEALVVSAVGPGAPAAESFLVVRAGASSADAEAVLSAADSGVKRAWACSDGARAYLVAADGTCFVAIGRDRAVAKLKLPALPEGFAYTGIGTTRKLAVVSWEEQDGWAVGAAGFLALDADALAGMETGDVL